MMYELSNDISCNNMKISVLMYDSLQRVLKWTKTGEGVGQKYIKSEELAPSHLWLGVGSVVPGSDTSLLHLLSASEQHIMLPKHQYKYQRQKQQQNNINNSSSLNFIDQN